MSTEAVAEGSTASKPGRVAISRGERLVILGIVVSIGAIGAYFSSRLAALEERMMGTAGRLEERMSGIIKEVDAKNTGTKDAVTKEVEAKIAGFRETADLKVRFRYAPGLRVHARPTR